MSTHYQQHIFWIIRRKNRRGLYSAADYATFFFILFIRKKKALRIIRRCGLYTGKYAPTHGITRLYDFRNENSLNLYKGHIKYSAF